jgi:hypothetical protein
LAPSLLFAHAHVLLSAFWRSLKRDISKMVNIEHYFTEIASATSHVWVFWLFALLTITQAGDCVTALVAG